ncbi:GH32 C-terminal domain-containing protein [Alkalihalobacillus sp. BA299]|uniref:glycoside hydrolase family 32 protein n=1 Tax=Alkalihalobacillus sp. BA299 TaxID=2815938 RepID=UPI0027DB2D0F|nr:GH32 C-terminal domain-containing protein [Alkalihalobacillus sp. BA299]
MDGEDHDTDLKQVQALAVSEDGIHFTKLDENPVIGDAPEGDIHPYHFRDPKVWKHENVYYSVIGSRTKDHIGQVLLYRSEDLIQWEFVNVAAKDEGNCGFMWECPDFFHLDGKNVLVMSPQGMKPEGHRFQNLHQAGYVFGNLDYGKGIFEIGDFQMLDDGFDFYAPQTMVDEKGRRILIAWMDMWESEMPTQKFNWAGAMTIPRLLQVKGDQLMTQPVPELKELRQNEVSYSNTSFTGDTSFPDVFGSCLELSVTIDAQKALDFGLKLRVNEELGEETVLTYKKENSLLTVDRNKSGEGVNGERSTEIKLINNELNLQIFIDQSSIEVFINEGER